MGEEYVPAAGEGGFYHFPQKPKSMARTITTAQGGMPSVGFSLIVFLLLLLGTFLYFYQPEETDPPPLAAATGPTAIEYEVTTSDITVDWSGGGDFDPRDKCPPDFFREGFVVLYKRVADGGYFRFLYHKGRKLLYRIDKGVAGGKIRIGLHWVESTKFSSKYRIADPAFKGGKTVKVPNAKGGKGAQTFHYGQAVSKRRVQWERELFRETHIDPDQCPEWWDILNFFP